jgi:hypothetical protein
MKYPGFIHSSYRSQSVIADQERTVNWYPEKMESPGASTEMALYPTPGVTLLSEATNGPGRAHFYMDGREFAVIGAKFFEIDIDGNQTDRGDVALDSNPATISSNGDGGGQLFVTSGTYAYCYDLSANTLTQITDLDTKATMGAHLDGYFLALDATNSTLYISALLDGTSWTTGTDFAQRSIAPDPWVSMRVVGRYIWLLGQQTSEVWYNAGTSPFPFAAHSSGLIAHGCAAAFSAFVAEKRIYWLSVTQQGGLRAVRAAGFSPDVISDHPTQTIFDSYDTVSDAVADIYIENGHTFYIVSFPRENKTWVWDASTSLWSERGTWIAEDNEFIALRTRYHAYAFNQHRWLDSVTGSIYSMDAESSSDVDSRVIRRVRRAPALSVENQRIFYSAFELDMEPGLGLESGQGSDPMVMMRLSNDGGKTWGAERMRSAGKIGEYGTRVRWNRCGAGRRRVFEVSVSDPIPYRLIGAYLTLGQPIAGASQPQQQRSAA